VINLTLYKRRKLFSKFQKIILSLPKIAQHKFWTFIQPAFGTKPDPASRYYLGKIMLFIVEKFQLLLQLPVFVVWTKKQQSFNYLSYSFIHSFFLSSFLSFFLSFFQAFNSYSGRQPLFNVDTTPLPTTKSNAANTTFFCLICILCTLPSFWRLQLLGTITKLQRATICLVMSVRLPILPSIRLPLNRFL